MIFAPWVEVQRADSEWSSDDHMSAHPTPFRRRDSISVCVYAACVAAFRRRFCSEHRSEKVYPAALSGLRIAPVPSQSCDKNVRYLCS